jgi:aminocarboxymuconate-semialdehyde decarboxylase
MKAIDVHTHVVPAYIPHEPARDRLWPSVQPTTGDQAAVVIDGKGFRVIDARSWDAPRRLADMEREGIGVQVLSPMPELLSYWIAPRDAEYLAAIVNEMIAGMVAVAPDRFVGLGMIAAQDSASAQTALAKVAELGLAGIEIGTHINGTPLGHESLWPVYEAAEALGLAIFVHPLHPCGLDRMDAAEIGVIASFPIEIAMAALSLMNAGVLRRFPRLRILLSHGGGALPSVLGRVEMARKLMPSIDRALGDDAWQVARGFWFDSNVYDAAALGVLADRLGRDRVVVGSDYPFLIRQEHPGDFVEQALPGSAAQCCANALALLGHGTLAA